MKTAVNLLDVVALKENIPGKNLYLGQVGTVVELLSSGVFEVEFIDNEGITYATEAVSEDNLIVLQYHPIEDQQEALA